jgi:hypothetical protein
LKPVKVWQVEQFGVVPPTAPYVTWDAGGYDVWHAAQAISFVSISIFPSLCVVVASVVGGTAWQLEQVDPAACVYFTVPV